MTDLDLLNALKTDLGITGPAYDDRLVQLIASATAAITQEGAQLDTATSFMDCQLVIMYADWLWRRRDTMEGMPRMLRWALNNKILAGKMRDEGDDA